ncbi:hypothetical protein ISCGN_019457 [Ixodes scapularis]
MLNARLQWWLESNQLLSPSQYGFRPGLSTQDVMSRLQHDTLSTSSPHLRIVAGVDVRKAFDSVPHSSVLSIAQQLGITGRAYNFIAAFLEDRTFTVHVGSSHGITHTNRVGVPQGSVLSPVLFNIAILRYLEDPQAPPLGSRLLKQYEPIIAAARRLSAPVPRADVGAAALRDAVRDFDLVGVTETLDNFSPRFTRWRGASQARLDRVYVSGEWSGSVVSYDAKIVPFSDHGFVAAEILAGGPGGARARRDTPWKMNSSILESEDFIEETRRALRNLEEGGADAVSWEEFKIKLRNAACALGRRRGAGERQARIHLTNTLKALLEEEESSPGSFSDDIKLCKEHLLAMLEERYKGAQVRSRVETLEGETQPSKIFRTHERKRATENTIKELRQGARVFTSKEDIAGVFETSFGELFREERLDDVAFEPFLRGSPLVPEGAVDILNCPIREAEVLHAIKHLSRNKAPGPDGIGSEFYKIFSDALCPILARVFNDIRRRRLLPPTMRQSFTVLIPKKSQKGPISEVGTFGPSVFFALIIKSWPRSSQGDLTQGSSPS